MAAPARGVGCSAPSPVMAGGESRRIHGGFASSGNAGRGFPALTMRHPSPLDCPCPAGCWLQHTFPMFGTLCIIQAFVCPFCSLLRSSFSPVREGMEPHRHAGIAAGRCGEGQGPATGSGAWRARSGNQECMGIRMLRCSLAVSATSCGKKPQRGACSAIEILRTRSSSPECRGVRSYGYSLDFFTATPMSRSQALPPARIPLGYASPACIFSPKPTLR